MQQDLKDVLSRTCTGSDELQSKMIVLQSSNSKRRWDAEMSLCMQKNFLFMLLAVATHPVPEMLTLRRKMKELASELR